MNPCDPCVRNKTIKGKQITICFHVDDCKISHVSEKVVDYTVAWLRQEYESIFTNGTGKMKEARGKVHTYLGMTLDFTTPKLVKVTMIDYVDEIIESGTRHAVYSMTDTRQEQNCSTRRSIQGR